MLLRSITFDHIWDHYGNKKKELSMLVVFFFVSSKYFNTKFHPIKAGNLLNVEGYSRTANGYWGMWYAWKRWKEDSM